MHGVEHLPLLELHLHLLHLVLQDLVLLHLLHPLRRQALQFLLDFIDSGLERQRELGTEGVLGLDVVLMAVDQGLILLAKTIVEFLQFFFVLSLLAYQCLGLAMFFQGRTVIL